MSSGGVLAYHLRPNKAVERELFVELLSTVTAPLRLVNYRYIGLGGPFLEDFRVIYSRLGIKELVCIERDKAVHERQRFNAPVPNIEFRQSSLSDYFESERLEETKCVVWLDFTEPKTRREQIRLFTDIVMATAPGSIVKLTLNANAASVLSAQQLPADERAELNTQRLTRLRQDLGNFVPGAAVPEDMGRKRFPFLLAQCVKLALDRRSEQTAMSYVGLNSFYYSDGQPMVTMTVAVVEANKGSEFLARTSLEDWEYYSPRWWKPRLIDVPVLSPRERLMLERCAEETEVMAESAELAGFLPASPLGSGPLSAFFTFRRLIPSFARVVY